MTVRVGRRAEGRCVISPRTWQAARLAGGVAVLGVLVWRVGAGPFLEGLRMTSGWAVVAAIAITACTTACCAWRWSLVAAGLGVRVPLTVAVGGYYRSQFLNATLPGGVLGDVHRGLRHGRSVEDLSGGLRSVAWERTAGQAVQIALTAGLLLAVSTPLGAGGTLVAGLAAVAAVAVVLRLRHGARGSGSRRDIGHDRRRAASSRAGHVLRVVVGDLRGAVLARRVWPGIVLASALVLAGHVAVFAVAVRSTGLELPFDRLFPVALVVLQAAALPTNIAGWGPREGASAWAFGAAGVGAAAGVSVAVVYGVLALLATVPGAVLLVADRRAVGQRGPRDRALAARSEMVVTPDGPRGEGEVHA